VLSCNWSRQDFHDRSDLTLIGNGCRKLLWSCPQFFCFSIAVWLPVLAAVYIQWLLQGNVLKSTNSHKQLVHLRRLYANGFEDCHSFARLLVYCNKVITLQYVFWQTDVYSWYRMHKCSFLWWALHSVIFPNIFGSMTDFHADRSTHLGVHHGDSTVWRDRSRHRADSRLTSRRNTGTWL